MKNNKLKKIVPACIAVLIILALGFTSGCGGCIGCIGCAGLLSGIGTITDKVAYIKDSVEDIEVFPETEWEEPAVESPDAGDLLPDDDLPERISNSPVKYTGYDPEYFNSLCDDLEEAASGKDFEKIKNLYDELYKEEARLDDQYTALDIEYNRNFCEEWADERSEFSAFAKKCYDRAESVLHEICTGPCADRFKEYVGDDIFDYFADYSELTDEELELTEKENKLVAEYNAFLEELQASGGYADESFLKKAGPVYVELVEVRNKIANLNGYENYADYADAEIYMRDYGSEEAEKFYAAVKQVSPRIYDLYTNTYTAFLPYLIYEETDTEDVLDILKTYAPKISSYAEEAAGKLIKDKLYDIGDESERLAAGFTTTFNGAGVPFIFINSGSFDLMTTIFHEFGHFVNSYEDDERNIMVADMSFDLAEIHSTGYEALMSNFFYDIYGEYGGQMKVYEAISLLYSVYSGCLYDEFQREVYSNPGMTYQEIQKLYAKLSREYSGAAADDYEWLLITHNFESPMYYLSYAASSIVSLQIWLTMDTSFEKAAQIWEGFIEAGSRNTKYMELVDQMNLSRFTDGLAVSMTCDTVLDWCEANAMYINIQPSFSFNW